MKKIMKRLLTGVLTLATVFTALPVTQVHAADISHIDEMEVANIAPKEIQVLKQSIYVMYDMLDKIQGADKVELQYKDEKDKNRKIILSNKVITTDDYVQE